MAEGDENPFTELEIKKMEKLFEEGKEDFSDPNFLQTLTEEFNHASSRSGILAIQPKQVQRWFEKRKNLSRAAATPLSSLEELVGATDGSLFNNALVCSSDKPKDTDEKVQELMQLEYEAQSKRDLAWYDVDFFPSFRETEGEQEVLVRFKGFGAEDDEWVNIKTSVRERSIPIKSSDCRKVQVGDLLLCFRDRGDLDAMHFDARCTSIERKQHDVRGCRCLFEVEYDHDQTKEIVRLKRLCRRPTN